MNDHLAVTLLIAGLLGVLVALGMALWRLLSDTLRILLSIAEALDRMAQKDSIQVNGTVRVQGDVHTQSSPWGS